MSPSGRGVISMVAARLSQGCDGGAARVIVWVFLGRFGRLFGANRVFNRFFSGFSPIFPWSGILGLFAARKCEARGGVGAVAIRWLAGVKRSAPIGA